MAPSTIASRRARISPPALTLATAGVLLVAGVNYLAGLGSSSLYTDEGFSWHVAMRPSIGAAIDRVAELDVTPPLYNLGLQQVTGKVSDSEIAMRLPSVLAGLCLVVAILWVGRLVAGPRVGVIAAGLAALSPLVMEHSQQARAYVFVMLGVTVAAGALLEAQRREPGDVARRRWLVVLVAVSIVSFWTHYTAALGIGPLLVLAVLQRRVSGREALGVGAAIGVGWLVVAPLMVHQLGHGHTEGIGALARLTLANVVEVVGTPFDSRYEYFDLTPAAAVGAALVAGAGLIALLRPPAEWPLVRSMVLPLAFVPALAVVALTVLSTDVLLTRYAAVGGPFMILLLAAVADARRSRPAIAALGLAVLAAATGSVLAHTPEGHYQDWRAAAQATAEEPGRAETVVLTHTAIGPTFDYYSRRAGIALPWVGGEDRDAVEELVEQKRRLWLFLSPPPAPGDLRAGLEAIGYRGVDKRSFVGNDPLQLILAVPSDR